MTKRSTAGMAAAALLIGTLACAGGMAREDDTAAAQDTTETQTPPGYSGMERDTTQVPSDSQPTAVDTFLNEQGTGVPADTAGYSGMEHPDTTGAAAQDTSSAGVDTSGMSQDTSGMSQDTSGMSQDTSGMGTMDTTGTTGVDTTTPQ